MLLLFATTYGAGQGSNSEVVLSRTAETHQPTSSSRGIDWFRRADELTNIRLPDSPPFHMKATFQAYPGVDFAEPGKSTIQTGGGTYEETWVAPNQWRREVSFGNYHAVEIRADGVRKFDASSEYEPSRVMMLMSALLVPVPRSLVEPELDESRLHWKVEHLMAGTIPWVRVSVNQSGWHGVPMVCAYDFLPNGILVRREEQDTGLMTSWEQSQPFGVKLVPSHISVRGAGLDHEMLTADVSIRPLEPAERSLAQLAGAPADPGMTLKPFEWAELNGGEPIHFETPMVYDDRPYPQHVKTSVIAVSDRHGMPHEAEVSGIRIYGERPSEEGMEVVTNAARTLVESIRRDRFRPQTIDGKAVQCYWTVSYYSRE